MKGFVEEVAILCRGVEIACNARLKSKRPYDR